jgi:opacity protein-like surface antigen
LGELSEFAPIELELVETAEQAELSQTSGTSKFASTWGLGVKSYPNPKLALKLGFRWTPTNLGETADEWVCSPYYPAECTVGGNTQYAHQYEFSVGVALRF